jgi:hypothetical protein
MFFFAASVSGANEDVELHIKAAYLLNFARFVEWPLPSAEASAPVVIAVLGDDSIAAALEATVHGKKINGHPIKIRQFATPEQIDRCDILFVPRSEAKKSRSVLADLSGKPILTVGEASGFLSQGGIIEFQVVDDTLRFSINVGAADRSGLKIRSELLSVAYSITGKQK